MLPLVFRLKRTEAKKSAAELAQVYSKLHQIHMIEHGNDKYASLLLGLTAVNLAESASVSLITPNVLARMYMLLAITLKQYRYSLFQFMTRYAKLIEFVLEC